YAIYSNAQLIKQHGSFPYGYSAGNWLEGVDNEGFVNYDGYSHYVAHTDSETTVILSKPLLDFSSAITAFSYLFAFYSVILLIFILARNIVLKQGIRSFNINSKIQLLLVLIILASTVLFGLGTSYFIKRQYDEKNNKNISERMRSVLIEVKHKLGENKGLRDVSSEYLSGILNKFSNVFFTDINLYDLSGKLVASSRIEIFDRNLISNMMDPAAYQSIKYSFKNSFVHEESIGNLHYLSAYAPFTNQAGQIMGYINLPYFARQGEMEKEISSFLVALINIYVFLFALSVIAALLISGFVTSPLRKIQNMLSNIELGKSNRQISYDKKDEIGQLVTVYNKKVLELQKSVELLAKSERESAWRDMAKQVAHEIKNPLTPMRLSVQHLLRTIKDNPASAKEQIDKFSENIIGQIDTLSHIADEFSHFAKMPSASFDEMDFNLVLSSAISLFKDADNTRIELNKTNEPLWVKGDKEQLNRVIINLLKNAFQSIPPGRKGIIRINIRDGSKSDFILSVADNGVGIPDEQKGKIFTPNFTTKSTGMGMGLVMVKSIVENHRGN
ncbi:MAG: ATP-binding protein, partial [Flavobacteriales bacterium]